MRWSWMVLVGGCMPGGTGWLGDLVPRWGADPEAPLADLVLRTDARMLLAGPTLDLEGPGELRLVSSDPAVVDVPSLDAAVVLEGGLEDGSVVAGGDQAVAWGIDEEEGEELLVEIVTGQAGTAELAWVDGETGEVVDALEVEVAAPARVELGPPNPAGWDALDGVEPRVLAGEQYILRARAYDVLGRPLSGWSVLAPASLSDENELPGWIWPLDLVVADLETPLDRAVEGYLRGAGWDWVDPADVVELELRPTRNPEGHAALLLVGVDRKGGDVLGIPALWGQDGAEAGDLYGYLEDPAAPEVEVTARWNGLEASAWVRQRVAGEVLQSDALANGCSTARVPALWASVGLVAAALGRRSRRGV